jgi:hypothetical protein
MSDQVQESGPMDVIKALSNELSHERYWLRRYRDALRRIAYGHGDPVTIAIEALPDDDAEDET